MAINDRFLGATEKLTIATVYLEEGPKDLVVTAQYNPKELQVSQPIGWTEHESLEGQHATKIVMEFGGVKASTMQVELLFDGVENEGRIGKGGRQVMEQIEMLKKLASVRDPSSPNPEHRRPYWCLVTWGSNGVRPFRCVIESLTTKYLVFDRDGRVLRASCTVGLKEADMVQLTRKNKDGSRVAA